MTQESKIDTRRRFRGELALCLVTITWGTTFITIQDAMAVWPPMALQAIRFGLATLVCLPLLLKERGDLQAWLKGAIMGTFIFLGFGLQTLALVYTTAARTAFAAALVTVFVPLFALVGLGIRWRAGTYFASCAAGIGVYLLMGRELGPGVRFGDLLALGCAAGFAVQVLLLGHFTRKPGVKTVPMLLGQLGTTTLLSAICSWALNEPMPEAPTEAWEMMLYLGVVTTGFCLLGQIYGQVRTTSTRAAFIYALEPISAAAFAWLIHDQGLSDVEWVGGTLIVLAAITADQALPARLRFRKRGAAESPLTPSEPVDTARHDSSAHPMARVSDPEPQSGHASLS